MSSLRFAKKDRYATAMMQEPRPIEPRPIVRRSAPVFTPVAPVVFTPEPEPVLPPAVEDLEYEEFCNNDGGLFSDDDVIELHEESDDVEYDNIGRSEQPIYRTVSESGPSSSSRPAPVFTRPTIPNVPVKAWAKTTSSEIANDLATYEPDSEEDLVVDEVDVITGQRGPQQLPVNTKIQAQVVHVIERETPPNPVLEKKRLMLIAYDQNGPLFGKYFLSRVKLPEIDTHAGPARPAASARPATKPKKVQSKSNAFAVLDAESDDEPELAPIALVTLVDKSAILRFCQAEAEAEQTVEQNEEADGAEKKDIAAPQEVEEVSAEVRARAAAKLEMIKANLAARQARAEAQRAARKAAAKPTTPVKSNKSNKRAATKQLANEFFYNRSAVSENEIRITLAQVHAPATLMTLVGMLTKRPEEMVKCRDDATHMVPLPPLAASTDVMVASPTQTNVLQTPPIIASLCRSGNDCNWYRKQAYIAFGAPVPQHLEKARECHFMHVSRDPLTLEMPAAGATEIFIETDRGDRYSSGWSRTEPVQFVQCSIQGCTQEQHYLPHDDERIHVVHMTSMSANCPCHHCGDGGYHCIHDGRNFCQNALVEGCCRQHTYSGPVLATLMMRAMLNFASQNPYKWPVTDYAALSGLWRQIVSIKVPGTDNDMGDRFRMKGIWPAEKNARPKTGRRNGH